MITAFILDILFSVLAFILSPLAALNDAALPTFITTAIEGVRGPLAIISQVVDLTAVLIIFGSFIAFEFVLGSYKGIMWIMRKVPGIS